MTEESLGKELLAVAVEIEKNGRLFYESLARRTREKETADVFGQLAAREREHEGTFKAILGRLGGFQPPQRDNGAYVRDLAASIVFANARAQAVVGDKSMTDIAALETGIGLEKDSILFYSEIRGMVPRADQEIVDVITSEEKKHLSELLYLANKSRGGERDH